MDPYREGAERILKRIAPKTLYGDDAEAVGGAFVELVAFGRQCALDAEKAKVEQIQVALNVFSCTCLHRIESLPSVVPKEEE